MGNPFPILYALLLLIGGLIGFLKAGSLASLFTGIIAAAFLGAGWYYEIKSLIITVVLLLTIFFVVRFTQSFIFMPNGLMAFISTTYLFFLVFGWNLSSSAME